MASTAIDPQAGPEANRGGGGAAGLVDQAKSQASRLADQGIAKVNQLAEGLKDDATRQLDAAVEVIREFANGAGAEFGSVAGNAINRGGDAMEGLAQGLRRNSVGDMVEETRSIITRHPGVAIGAASVIGFVAGRVAKGGLGQSGGARRTNFANADTEVAA